MSSDEEVITIRRRRNVVESDGSDEEIPSNSVTSPANVSEEVKDNETKMKKKLHLKVLESSSESEDEIKEDILTHTRNDSNMSTKNNSSMSTKNDSNMSPDNMSTNDTAQENDKSEVKNKVEL